MGYAYELKCFAWNLREELDEAWSTRWKALYQAGSVLYARQRGYTPDSLVTRIGAPEEDHPRGVNIDDPTDWISRTATSDHSDPRQSSQQRNLVWQSNYSGTTEMDAYNRDCKSSEFLCFFPEKLEIIVRIVWNLNTNKGEVPRHSRNSELSANPRCNGYIADPQAKEASIKWRCLRKGSSIPNLSRDSQSVISNTFDEDRCCFFLVHSGTHIEYLHNAAGGRWAGVIPRYLLVILFEQREGDEVMDRRWYNGCCGFCGFISGSAITTWH